MEDTMVSSVYVQTDAEGRITRCEGGYTTPSDLTGWTRIDQGTGDRYNLCQSNYFEGGLMTEDGLCRYKLADGKPVLRTEDELAAERAALPVPERPPTTAELAAENKKLKAQVEALTDQQSFYEDCIAEMAAVVYA